MAVPDEKADSIPDGKARLRPGTSSFQLERSRERRYTYNEPRSEQWRTSVVLDGTLLDDQSGASFSTDPDKLDNEVAGKGPAHKILNNEQW
jgi:hypothetical protein